MIALQHIAAHHPEAITPPTIKKKGFTMPFQRMDLMTLIAVVIVMGVLVVGVNTLGVNAIRAADIHFPRVALAEPQPAPAANDNTALWIALISSLTLNFFNLVQGMFQTWMQFKIKMASHDMQASLDVNTAITKQTQTEVKEGLADKSNH